MAVTNPNDVFITLMAIVLRMVFRNTLSSNRNLNQYSPVHSCLEKLLAGL